MAWFISIREGSHPMCHFEDGAEKIYLTGFVGGDQIVDSQDLPTRGVAEDTKPLRTDAFYVNTASSGRAVVVSEKFRSTIELLEPSTHQFFPVIMKNSKGEPLPDEFHIMRVRKAFPCILFSKSNCQPVGRIKAGPLEGSPYYFCEDEGAVLSKKSIENCHLWSSTIISPGSCFISDELMVAFKKAKISGLRAHLAVELDEEWTASNEVPEYLAWLDTKPELQPEHEKYLRGMR